MTNVEQLFYKNEIESKTSAKDFYMASDKIVLGSKSRKGCHGL